MKIVFLRHGESMGNTSGKFYDNDRTNFLSLRGILQAQLAAHTIKEYVGDSYPFDGVFDSELTRSGQTACITLQTLMEERDAIELDGRLNEWCFTANGNNKWYLEESHPDFWERIESFYFNDIKPLLKTDVSYFVVSHYYTMLGLFQVMAKDHGLISEYEPLSPNNDGEIPNAVPFFFDSTTDKLPHMAGSKDKSR
jgi:bisphosphoglycerate-dependent phosphoglycerate mutase